MSASESTDFYGLGLAPKLLEILEKNEFTKPTPIQTQTIPLAIEGKDLIGIAQTGSGKTLAFGLPMMQNIARQKTRGLIVVPTRELAEQVDQVLMGFGKSLGLKTAVIIGGASAHVQTRALNAKPHIIVATPGRMIDHLSDRPSLLQGIGIVVLDEADRMLDMGFAPQIEKILAKVPKARQTLLFSATMPQSIMGIANRHMHLPLRVEIAKPGTTVKEIDQEVVFLGPTEKRSMLRTILDSHAGSVLVFCRTKWGAKKLAMTVRGMGHSAEDISSNRTLSQRRSAIEGFKNGRHRVLVATDIAARGIDVSNIEVVVNFDLPSTPDDYVHRIGRTARAGRKGKAITFATPDEARDVQAIERLIHMPLVKRGHADLPRTAPRMYRDQQSKRMSSGKRSRPTRPGGRHRHSSKSRRGARRSR